MKDRKIDTIHLWQRISNQDDDKAFESLFHLLNTALIKFSMMYVHRKEVAEEIVSDVFVKCWLSRKSLSDLRNIDTYLFVAVKNQSLNHLKKYSHIHLVQVEDSSEIKFIRTSTPQETLEKKELFFKMEQSIEELPQQCRIIFRLIKEDGLKYKEVAEILNISVRTVQTQLFRATKKLSAILSEYLAPGNTTSASAASASHGANGNPDQTSIPPNALPSILLLLALSKIFF
ncbi:MAG: RNA polymerase sigma-70 factor [Bacteroidetes bacterium]|nr:RNA polymerase sigma-70 factor [Bacteroidota bacterium]